MSSHPAGPSSDPSHGPRNARGQTHAQFLTALSDHLPAAYLRAYAPHVQSLWADGCTVGEAVAYARAYLLAPSVCPAGWESVTAAPSDPAAGPGPISRNHSTRNDLDASL